MMDLDNRISEQEKKGRDKVVNTYGGVYTLVESTDKYASWDLSGRTSHIDKEDKNFFIEIKDRQVKSTSYNTCFLEYKKVSLLREVANAYDADMFYIVTYTDNKMYVFNLRKIDITQVSMSITPSPENTMNGEQIYVDKLFIELPFSLGKEVRIK